MKGRPANMTGIARLPSGSFRVTASIGSKRTGTLRSVPPKVFPAGVPIDVMQLWRSRMLVQLQEQIGQLPAPVDAPFCDDIPEYLRTNLTPTTRKQRAQQLAWWAAQLAAVGSPVYDVAELAAMQERGEKPDGQTLGELPRSAFPVKRLREILDIGFASRVPDDPTDRASTSNSYRTALGHLFERLDQDIDGAINPIRRIEVRAGRAAYKSGQDMRIVVEILKHTRSLYGPTDHITALRLDVLAWVHITSRQLKAIVPARDFHDVPDATRADILAGAITLTIQPRLKGRTKQRSIPETIPLNPWGVAAMRAFAANPHAHGSFSNSSANKTIKRAAREAQAALAARGYDVDLSAFHLYHLKHSLATATNLAAPQLMDRDGKMKIDPGLQRALGHARRKTSTIYTQAGIEPTVRQANTAVTIWLERLLKEPLAPPLRLVGAR